MYYAYARHAVNQQTMIGRTTSLEGELGLFK